MKRISRKSVYAPYYSRIQGLLFDGMSKADVWRYMTKYFDLDYTYQAFRVYTKKSGLDWFIPVKY